MASSLDVQEGAASEVICNSFLKSLVDSAKQDGVALVCFIKELPII